MTIDIHKVITGNPITNNLMKPWGSNKQKTIFNKYTGPGNDLSRQVKFNSKTGHSHHQTFWERFMTMLMTKWHNFELNF